MGPRVCTAIVTFLVYWDVDVMACFIRLRLHESTEGPIGYLYLRRLKADATPSNTGLN